MIDYIIETLVSTYHSLGVVGCSYHAALLKNNVTSGVLSWENYVVPNTLTKVADTWVKIGQGPASLKVMNGSANRFFYMPLFESTRGTGWHSELFFENADALVCPSTFIKDHLDRYSAPKIMWPHGFNPAYIKKKTTYNDSEPLKLLFCGKLDTRKYGDEFLKLFKDSFGDSREVTLTVKCQPDYKGKDSKNIKFIRKILAPADLFSLYYYHDALIMPSRGEGFGLMGLEAAATGLPIIATNWGGQVDYMKDCVHIPLEYKLIDTPYDGPWVGQWAAPDEGSIIDAISLLCDDRSYLERALHNNLEDKWSWENVTKIFLNNAKNL